MKRRNFLGDISPNDISIIVALLPSPRIHNQREVNQFRVKVTKEGTALRKDAGEAKIRVYEEKLEWRVSASMYDVRFEDAQSGEGKTG